MLTAAPSQLFPWFPDKPHHTFIWGWTSMLGHALTPLVNDLAPPPQLTGPSSQDCSRFSGISPWSTGLINIRSRPTFRVQKGQYTFTARGGLTSACWIWPEVFCNFDKWDRKCGEHSSCGSLYDRLLKWVPSRWGFDYNSCTFDAVKRVPRFLLPVNKPPTTMCFSPLGDFYLLEYWIKL